MKLDASLRKQYRDLSPLEIKRLAKDIFLGKVFTSHHVPEGANGELVFIPLLFLTDRELEILKKDPPGLLYEYNTQRGPKLVNDLPTFPTVQILSVAIADQVMKEVEAFSQKMADLHLEHAKKNS